MLHDGQAVNGTKCIMRTDVVYTIHSRERAIPRNTMQAMRLYREFETEADNGGVSHERYEAAIALDPLVEQYMY